MVQPVTTLLIECCAIGWLIYALIYPRDELRSLQATLGLIFVVMAIGTELGILTFVMKRGGFDFNAIKEKLKEGYL
jgi:hypothetical protein